MGEKLLKEEMISELERMQAKYEGIADKQIDLYAEYLENGNEELANVAFGRGDSYLKVIKDIKELINSIKEWEI